MFRYSLAPAKGVKGLEQAASIECCIMKLADNSRAGLGDEGGVSIYYTVSSLAPKV